MEITSESLKEKSREELIVLFQELDNQTKRNRQKIRQLENQLNEVRCAQVEQQNQAEVEEEFITNKLFKRLAELKKEKNQLIMQVEREEEYLTNTLQKKLAALQQEKVNLEQQLEIEEEYIVNKLQLQLEQLANENSELEKRIEEEVNPHSIQLRNLKAQFDDLKRKKERKISRLENENLMLKRQVGKFKEHYVVLKQEELQQEVNTELLDEYEFNESLKLEVAPTRTRSVSKRAPRSISKGGDALLLSPRAKKREGFYQRKILKKGWLLVRGDTADGETEETLSYYLVITEDILLGFISENIDVLSDDAAPIEIEFDLADKLETNSSGFTIKLKSGDVYYFTTEDATTWVKLIQELLPN